jgi:N-acetylglucosaminyl-diphospho-decaprenol L-rhamnosyltransferase
MKYSVSVISHKSGEHLEKLFLDLSKKLPINSEVILTINTPECESYLNNAHGLRLKILRNTIPQGFGANHNRAFSLSSGSKFIVINPDVRIDKEPWDSLNEAFDKDTGACAPTILSPYGNVEDSVRHFPTIKKLLKRVVLRKRIKDYESSDNSTPVVVDWVAGMFIMFDSASFKLIGGFDTNYYMYVEDVDICRRLTLIGKKILWLPSCNVIHSAQHKSRKKLQHFYWHTKSFGIYFKKYLSRKYSLQKNSKNKL